MALQGLAFFALSAIGLASLLYYMYANNTAEGYSNFDSNVVYSPALEHWGEEQCNTSQPHTSKNKGSTRNRKKGQSKKSSFNKTPEIECTICLQKINDQGMRLPCSHTFHIKCIEEWRSQGPIISRFTCPNCRENYVGN